MKMAVFVVFVILLQASLSSLAMEEKVSEGEESVVLPCHYSGLLPEVNPTVTWSRYDLKPRIVHLRREKDDLRGQNLQFRGRTSMRFDSLDSGDFSLRLRQPHLSDSGIYTCSFGDDREEIRVKDIQLQVKAQQVEVKVKEGAESAILPCKTTVYLEEDATVEWTRFEPEFMIVHVYQNGSNQDHKQDQFYCKRTRMNEKQVKSGDLSLTLRYPTERDSGVYICTIYRRSDIVRQKVILQIVKEKLTSWAKAFLIILVCLLVLGGLLFKFRHYFQNVYKVDVDSGVESVSLPCKTLVCLPEDVTVTWRNNKSKIVHCKNREDQDQQFKDRTEMKGNLKIGDFSLILKNPTYRDTDLYTCTIQNSLKKIQKQVLLNVKVYEVDVDSGVESVSLPCKTLVCMPEDVTVTWRTNESKIVHCKNLEDQDQQFKDRTEMEGNLKIGDFSLILKKPTDRDTDLYTCTIKNISEKILVEKQVLLNVKAGADSFIIAIDIGSAYSGYAYKVKSRVERDETQVKRWGNELGLDTPKTLTCILFDENEKFLKFGYEAKTKYLNMRGEEAKKHYFFENFKGALDGTELMDQTINAVNNKTMKALEVFKEFLRCLKDDALKTIKSHNAGGEFQASDFTWVLTVPANWDHPAKQFMRECAIQAGLITEYTKGKLMFALESEAASTWCLKLPSDGFIELNHCRDAQIQSSGARNTTISCEDPARFQVAVDVNVEEETKPLLKNLHERKYIVVNCGDEIIDFTVHQVLEGGALKKLYNFTGNNLGGKTVDTNFSKFLKQIFSDGVWEEYEQNFPSEVQNIMYEFTCLKQKNEDALIRCSYNLGMLAQKKKDIENFFDSVDGASWDDGDIRISREKLWSFYDGSLKGITKNLRAILKKKFNISCILLVGDFADSQILHQHISDQFGQQCKILCPFIPQEAILKGAVELGRNTKLVSSGKKCMGCLKCFL